MLIVTVSKSETLASDCGSEFDVPDMALDTSDAHIHTYVRHTWHTSPCSPLCTGSLRETEQREEINSKRSDSGRCRPHDGPTKCKYDGAVACLNGDHYFHMVSGGEGPRGKRKDGFDPAHTLWNMQVTSRGWT